MKARANIIKNKKVVTKYHQSSPLMSTLKVDFITKLNLKIKILLNFNYSFVKGKSNQLVLCKISEILKSHFVNSIINFVLVTFIRVFKFLKFRFSLI